MSEVTKTAPTVLTIAEQSKKAELEAIIEQGQKTFLKVGNALLEIRDARLYRDEQSTFEDYCEIRWGLGVRRAQQIMLAARTVLELPAEMRTTVRNEAQVRELAKVPKPKREAVLKAASTDGKKPATAAKIKETAKSFAPPPIVPLPVRLDETGHAIPVSLHAAWDRAEAWAANATKQISAIKSDLKKAMEDKDATFAEVSDQTFITTLTSIYRELKCVKPHTLCPSHTPQCKLCNGRGYISKFRFENAIPSEVRKRWENAA
jgi:hypothetical protein